MADLNISNPEVDDRPISLRRKRRSSASDGSRSRSNSRTATAPRPHGISTPPATPKRAKKRVRFSDPGPSGSESSGLTPFIRRTALSTPTSNRRYSMPATFWNHSPRQTPPPSGTIQFESVRSQILEDRVIRRLRRRELSEEFVKVESEKRHAARNQKNENQRLKSEVDELRAELARTKEELEIANQIGGDPAAIITRIQAQELRITERETALQEKESGAERNPDWTLAAQDPFDFPGDDMMIESYDQEFGESMNDELLMTPTRLRTSFPSSPSTVANTPSKRVFMNSAGIQVSLPIPDPEKAALRTQLEALQTEISKLTSKVALQDDNQSRLSEKLSEFLPTDASHGPSSLDSALDSVLTQLALSQSQALEQSCAFSALGSEITKLGFSPGSSPDKMIAEIAAQFRQARLELEYITPGEVEEGFENEKLLEMLVSRIRALNQRVKESDDKIDQYHEQEVSLRQQLNTRVDALQDVQGDLALARTIIEELKQENMDAATGNKRLKAALQTYRDEVRGLEKLVENMDKEKKQMEEKTKAKISEIESKLQTEILRHDSTTADAEGKNMLLAELERRLNAALQSQEDVEKRMDTLVSEKDLAIQELKRAGMDREKAHGKALALRDARCSELRGEIDRLNEDKKDSWNDRLELLREIQLLKDKAKAARKAGQVMMQERINRFMQKSIETPSAHSSPQRPGVEARTSAEEPSTECEPSLRRGMLFDASLARRRSSKGKRRPDSGVGLMEEDEETGDVDTSMGSVEA